FFAQRQGPRGKEVRQRDFDVLQPLEVGDELMALDGEAKAIRGFLGPGGKTLGLLVAIERAVDFDGSEGLAGKRKLLLLRQSLGVELAAPFGKIPTRNTNPDRASRGHLLVLPGA